MAKPAKTKDSVLIWVAGFCAESAGEISRRQKPPGHVAEMKSVLKGTAELSGALPERDLFKFLIPAVITAG
jgi:hypothetical protein